MYVTGDAATTTANVVAKAGVIRIAVVSDFVMVTAWVFLAFTLYRLLKHVHQDAASAMVIFVAIGAGIVSLNDVFAFEGMRVATDSSYAAALGAGERMPWCKCCSTPSATVVSPLRSSWDCGWFRWGILSTSQAFSPRRWAQRLSQSVSAIT